MLTKVTLETQAAEAETLHPLRPVGATAELVLRRAEALDGVPLVYIAQTTRRAQDILEVLATFAPDRRMAYFPPWDCLPGDRVAPSMGSMGKRMSVLRWMTDRKKRPTIVVTTAEALLRLVPPARIWKKVHVEIRVGETIDLKAFEAHLARIGYVVDDRVDEPGEVALRGKVIDLFPAAAPMPCRVEHEGGVVTSIRSYDPVTQRSFAPCEMLIVDPASEILEPQGASRDRESLDLAAHYDRLVSFFDYCPDASTIIEDGVDRRADGFFATIEEAAGDARDDAERDHILAAFQRRERWSSEIGTRLRAVVEEGSAEDQSAREFPRFAEAVRPWDAFAAFAEPLLEKGYRLVFTAVDAAALPALVARAEAALDRTAASVADWSGVEGAAPGMLVSLVAPIREGFVVPEERIFCIAASDVVGRRAAGGTAAGGSGFEIDATAFATGDAVVHLDHGVGVVEGLVPLDEKSGTEALRLRYAKDATLLVPLREIGALWRYGSAVDGVKLDTLKGDNWIERRNTVLEAIRRTAEGLVALAKENKARKARRIRPEPRFYERFSARFAFELTLDQAAAAEDVLSDLASGVRMDRLVCGDVGYGKTEVALRAAAAVVSAGYQVAIAAPTTVLAQQHARLFEKRFAHLGVAVAQLSRSTTPGEAKAIHEGLKDGTIGVVVGTHALAGKDVAFKNLGLVVIDEEQRFGMRDKEKLKSLGKDVHVLTMTATPIPRTLQAGLAGLHAISVIASPPVRRRPIETRVGPFEDETVSEVLLAERRRGGQSFVVCPRIEDIEPMAERLSALASDLTVTMIHGKMDAAKVDAAMLAFAGGQGDVLLATNIIESGLDVPAANTMIVTRPDRFGLSQLHQLRGRVGRGSRRGTVLLATDPDTPLAESAAARLETLTRLDKLGSGFEISMRDLDARGAGDFLGEEQAGHLQLIGIALYRNVLKRALAAADGKDLPDEWTAEIALGIEGVIPADYVPEPELRIDLACRFDRIREEDELDILSSEIEDRFGPLPQMLDTGFRIARLRLQCCEAGIRRLDGGPKALAATFDRKSAERMKTLVADGDGLRWSALRLVDVASCDDPLERLGHAELFVARILRASRGERAALTSGRRGEHAGTRAKKKAKT